jgi:DNA-binding transcriptional regulator YdaS (Cro superfamily)
MKLHEWMIANGFGDGKVAELTGLHRTTVWKLRKGMRRPEPWVMDLLVKVSHGAITRPELRPDLYPIDHVRPLKPTHAAE